MPFPINSTSTMPSSITSSASSETEVVLRLKNIRKSFDSLTILAGVNLEIRKGEMVGLVAPSGSGKTTMLQICGLIDEAYEGEITLDHHICTATSDSELSYIRRHHLGFVFQHHRLLPELTAEENVALPLMLQRTSRDQALVRSRDLLSQVGLAERFYHYSSQLSGGEQQRVAIARAFITQPQLIIADEPTGNLDQVSGGKVFELLQGLVRKTQAAALIATHNLELASRLDRLITIKEQRLAEFQVSKKP